MYLYPDVLCCEYLNVNAEDCNTLELIPIQRIKAFECALCETARADMHENIDTIFCFKHNCITTANDALRKPRGDDISYCASQIHRQKKRNSNGLLNIAIASLQLNYLCVMG